MTDPAITEAQDARRQRIIAARDAGCTALDLSFAGCTAKDLREAGCGPDEMFAAHFTTSELREAGYSAADLDWANERLKKTRERRDVIAAMRADGCSAADVLAEDFDFSDLRAVGYTIAKIIDGGMPKLDRAGAGKAAA